MPELQEEYYEIMYNNDYGGFYLPHEFIEAVFRAYPPDSEIGSKLFTPSRPFDRERHILQGADPDPSWDSYDIIVGERNFYHGYKRLVTKRAHKDKHGQIKIAEDVCSRDYSYYTKDNVNYYFLSAYNDDWRDIPEVIELGKKFQLFKNASDQEDEQNNQNQNNENSDSDDDSDDQTDENDDDDDDETVLLDDENEMEIVTDACKGQTDLVLKKIPIGYEYRIDEYDGNERVIIVFPYKKVIQELLEARQTHSDDNLGPIAKKLVEGTLDVTRI